MGKIVAHRYKSGALTYSLRFTVTEQKIIFPKIIPYLGQKKQRAEIILRFLLFRSKGSMVSKINQKIRPLIEQYYLDLENEFSQATLAEKPWVKAIGVMHRGRSKHPMKIRDADIILKESKNYVI